jgi:hypothetical protein
MVKVAAIQEAAEVVAEAQAVKSLAVAQTVRALIATQLIGEAVAQRAMQALHYPGTGGEHAQTRLVSGPATLPR